MAKLLVPVNDVLRCSCGKEPQNAYLRYFRSLVKFQREERAAPHLGAHTLLWEEVDQTCSWKACPFQHSLCQKLMLICFLHIVRDLDKLSPFVFIAAD